MKIQQYKIFDPNTGLFSKGGIRAHKDKYDWSKKGKLWTSAGALRRHLNQYTETFYLNRDYSKPQFRNFIPEKWIVIEQVVTDDGQFIEQQYNAKLFYDKKHLD